MTVWLGKILRYSILNGFGSFAIQICINTDDMQATVHQIFFTDTAQKFTEISMFRDSREEVHVH